MTKLEIKSLVEELLDGIVMSEALFDNFLNFAQMYYENRRPWVYLRAEDTTQSISQSNTFTTEKTLPSDFRRWYTRYPLKLVDSDGNPQAYVTEIPIDKKHAFRTDNTKFYCDYKNGKLYVCGNPSQSLTIAMFYIQKSTLVSEGDNNEWTFPSEYHPILAFSIAAFYKNGVDYDIINSRQADEHIRSAQMIYSSMEEWDSELAESALNGVDYPTGDSQSFSGQLSGHISM